MKVNKSNKSVKHFSLELLLFYSKKKKKKSLKFTKNFSHPKLTFANEEFFFFWEINLYRNKTQLEKYFCERICQF